jgi:thiaminase/transcriptional activator TenA
VDSPFIQEAGPLWREATSSSFLDAIAAGRLPKEAFNRWLAQDYHFASGLMAFQALALSRAPRLSHATLIAGLQALDTELAWFESHAAGRGLDLDQPLHPICRRYTNFLIRCAYTDEPATLLAVLFGVEVSYLAAWRALDPSGPYAEVIERWSNTAFRDYVERLRGLADPGRGPVAQQRFNDVLRHEREFWRMTWEG